MSIDLADKVLVAISTPIIYCGFSTEYIRVSSYVEDEGKIYFILLPVSDFTVFSRLEYESRGMLLIVSNIREINDDRFLIVDIGETKRKYNETEGAFTHKI